jgi:hypothetical protein
LLAETEDIIASNASKDAIVAAFAAAAPWFHLPLDQYRLVWSLPAADAAALPAQLSRRTVSSPNQGATTPTELGTAFRASQKKVLALPPMPCTKISRLWTDRGWDRSTEE